MMRTTEMVQFLAVLLLTFLLAVKGTTTTSPEMDPCTNGIAVLTTFHSLSACGGEDPSTAIYQFSHSSPGNWTVASLRTVTSNYCSSVLPAMRECFAKQIQHCSASQQDYLNTVASETRFLCQPNSNEISPEISFLLSKLTDADLVENEHCDVDGHNEQCALAALLSVGLTPEDFQIIRSATIQDLVPMIRTYSSTEFRCLVDKARQQPRCPQWRGQALFTARHHLVDILGQNLTFTQAEITEMFEF